MIDWQRIEALSFDCYGTLIDWETGILRALDPWRARQGLEVDDGELLAAYGEEEHEAQRAVPNASYPDILRAVVSGLASRFGVDCDESDRDALATSVGAWPAFDDTAEALQVLKRRFRLAILSNVDEASFALTRRQLRVEFDLICTAERIGSYKPDPRNFEFLLAELGVPRERLVHVAQSLFHDHAPAKSLGLATVFIDRPARYGASAAKAPPPGVEPDLRFESMAELAAAI